MYLYNKTLLAGSNVNEVAVGHFLGKSEAQLAILRGTALSLYNLMDNNCFHIITMPLFGIGRCMKTLHLVDYYKDLLVLTSDSGCLTILEFDLESNILKPIINKKFGNNGFQKEIPGQYLQISPDNHYIAIGAIYEKLILFPIKYTLSIDRKQIQFDLSTKIQYSYSQSIIYDIAWSDEQTLLVYQANEITYEKQIQSLIIEHDTPSSTLSVNLSQVYPDEEITRIISYEKQLVLLCKNHLIRHQDSSSLPYPSSNSIITCSCITPLGLTFACDRGYIFYLSSHSQSLTTISPPFKHGGYVIHLCCTDTTLYLFFNNGYHSCLLFSSLSMNSYNSIPFSHCLSSIGYCNHLTSLKTKSKSQHYLASIGNGSASALASITIGQTFMINPVKSSNSKNAILLADHAYCLPSLTDPMVDEYLITPIIKETVVYSKSRTDNDFKLIKTGPFIFKEHTINVGVYHNIYIQITPNAVYALSNDSCLGSWETTADAPIETSYIGNNTIIVVRKKQNILCLRWDNYRFVNLDEFISQSEVTCVFEMNEYLLAGSRDRSIRVYQIDNNSITEKSYCLVDAIPRYLYSFATITNTAYNNYKTSNDQTIFVGCDEGCLVLMTFKKDTPELEIIQSSIIDTAKDTICLSSSIFNHIPALFISSNSIAYLIYRNAIFDFIPISIGRKDGNGQVIEELSSSISTRHLGHGFTVFRSQDLNSYIFLWKHGQLYRVSCDNSLPKSTVIINSCPATCRSIIDCSSQLYLCYFNDYPSSVYEQVVNSTIHGVYLNDKDSLVLVQYFHSNFSNEMITAISLCYEVSTDYQDKKSYFMIGSMNLQDNEYYLSCYISSEQPNKNTYSLMLKWKINMEAKVFNIIPLSNQWIALVVGNLLRIVKVSSTGISLISQIKCSSSFITSIHYKFNRFYLTDNSGVISIIGFNQNQLYYLLHHETNRSLMRSCVVDEITMAVSDKYGNLLIYRSLFPMDYLIHTMQPSSIDYRWTTSYSMSLIASYYIGELITSIFMEELKNSVKVITYATIYGTIGYLYPITNVNDLEVITGLESIIMGKGVSLVGRIVDDFRSTYIPSLSIVDGNICRLFFQYSEEEQESIASQLEMSVCEVKRKILEINNMEFKSQPKKGEEQ